MVAETFQIANQIMLDMKNIYDFKDIIELSVNNVNKGQEFEGYIP